MASGVRDGTEDGRMIVVNMKVSTDEARLIADLLYDHLNFLIDDSLPEDVPVGAVEKAKDLVQRFSDVGSLHAGT